MKKTLLLLTVCFVLISRTDEQGARKTLIDAGYKPIEVGGYDPFAGSESDWYITKFKAYSP
ncbi:hypothetical protein GGR21_002478 [Dysgonomonas hofstadii]|uniref:Uncharacterized protein n=1 Tax=Dysgonomonas hofstadii TaxID=637886 RepID=A0A840CVS0_9BACT|nr:hypothetical protein [Dysgonomonas hofstadii]MBB4036572.1 hypothetical protein [Dysgonomonas hofstadii]